MKFALNIFMVIKNRDVPVPVMVKPKCPFMMRVGRGRRRILTTRLGETSWGGLYRMPGRYKSLPYRIKMEEYDFVTV